MKRAFVPMAMLLALLMSTASEATGGGGSENTWTLSDPILSSGPIGTFSEIAVKDPSIVCFEGMWHVFFTRAEQRGIHHRLRVRKGPGRAANGTKTRIEDD